ncbi:hypothetical protein ElyMa_000401300 [Elysia marginata]|uniref:Uncharacterized protein n=1 Tax=Elysia marginata TaxID=1093978 RepID=A0AAV4FJ38_9GAST|nr:hypothetical protein ElyMa_000401300 [Elysia marginata]
MYCSCFLCFRCWAGYGPGAVCSRPKGRWSRVLVFQQAPEQTQRELNRTTDHIAHPMKYYVEDPASLPRHLSIPPGCFDWLISADDDNDDDERRSKEYTRMNSLFIAKPQKPQIFR